MKICQTSSVILLYSKSVNITQSTVDCQSWRNQLWICRLQLILFPVRREQIYFKMRTITPTEFTTSVRRRRCRLPTTTASGWCQRNAPAVAALDLESIMIVKIFHAPPPKKSAHVQHSLRDCPKGRTEDDWSYRHFGPSLYCWDPLQAEDEPGAISPPRGSL